MRKGKCRRILINPLSLLYGDPWISDVICVIWGTFQSPVGAGVIELWLLRVKVIAGPDNETTLTWHDVMFSAAIKYTNYFETVDLGFQGHLSKASHYVVAMETCLKVVSV